LRKYFYSLVFSKLDEKKRIDEKEEPNKQLNYKQYTERMHLLSQNRRNEILHRKKDYCQYIPDILKEANLPIIHSPAKRKIK